eukprot:365994-Chlamydomonas_euryale.AAC.7
MPISTTAPATSEPRKFFNDGVTPASATSGCANAAAAPETTAACSTAALEAFSELRERESNNVSMRRSVRRGWGGVLEGDRATVLQNTAYPRTHPSRRRQAESSPARFSPCSCITPRFLACNTHGARSRRPRPCNRRRAHRVEVGSCHGLRSALPSPYRRLPTAALSRT